MKKILPFFGVLFGLLFLYSLLLNSQEIRRLYHLNFLFDAASIRENFQHMPLLFSTKTVENLSEQTSSNSFNKNPETTFTLPATFSFDNFDVSSDYFLRYTNTSALLIIKDQQLVYENYFEAEQNEHQRSSENLYIAWSLSKSIVSTLAGIAIEEGAIKNIDDLIITYLPELQNTAYQSVTIRQLLHMTSGVEFNEDYADFFSDINIFSYYLALGLNTTDYIRSLKNNTHSGQHLYTSIDTEVLALVISASTGKSLSAYLSEKIWQPLAMEKNALWISDAYGNEFAAGGLNASPRDYARFGLLIANQGSLNGKEIISKNWLANIGKTENRVRAEGYDVYDYSYQWWIPQDTLDNEMLAIGIYDQYIYINRSNNLVIVKLSANPNYISDNYISESQSLAFFRKIADSF